MFQNDGFRSRDFESVSISNQHKNSHRKITLIFGFIPVRLDVTRSSVRITIYFIHLKYNRTLRLAAEMRKAILVPIIIYKYLGIKMFNVFN